MLATLKIALAARGMKMHPSKCQVQTNAEHLVTRGVVAFDEESSITILAEGEGLKVLGTKLTLKDVTVAEIEHRISCGWRMFWTMKRIFTNRKI